jgi:hypothetical protein
MKTCKHCGEEKPLEDFVKTTLTNDGTISTCKVCYAKKRLSKRYEVTLTEKECFTCKTVKPAEDFPKNPGLIGGLHTYCKTCSNTKNKENEYYKTSQQVRKERLRTDPEYKLHVLSEKNKNRKKNIVTSLLINCRNRAKERNLEFDLTKEDIIVPALCPILLKPLICGDKNDYSFSPSVDRIDNSKGYTKDNIQVISMKANKMKNNATKEELLNFAKWIKKTL